MLVLGKFDGGVTRASLAAILGTGKQNFRQFTLYPDPLNSGSVYVGPVTVTSVPANEQLRLAAGVPLNLGPVNAERPFTIDTNNIYVVGSAASQVLYVIAMVDDGT